MHAAVTHAILELVRLHGLCAPPAPAGGRGGCGAEAEGASGEGGSMRQAAGKGCKGRRVTAVPLGLPCAGGDLPRHGGGCAVDFSGSALARCLVRLHAVREGAVTAREGMRSVEKGRGGGEARPTRRPAFPSTHASQRGRGGGGRARTSLSCPLERVLACDPPSVGQSRRSRRRSCGLCHAAPLQPTAQ